MLAFATIAMPLTFLCPERACDLPRQDAADALLQQLREELGWLVADDVDRDNMRTLADDDDTGGDEERDYSFADGGSSTAFTEAHGRPPKTQQKPGESLEEW
jgi:hypothetical protein